jgi:hypothetical protein
MLANTLIAWWRQHGSVAGTAAFATGMLKFAEENGSKEMAAFSAQINPRGRQASICDCHTKNAPSLADD